MRIANKDAIRRKIWTLMLEEGISSRTYGHIPPFRGQEDAAELLRKLLIYMNASRVMVPPDYALYYVRLNVLKDGKTLIMATPGLKDGFYELSKNFLRKDLWKIAILSHKVMHYGRRLRTSIEDIGKIDLLVTGAVAVSTKHGERIGKGTGFFDWEYAILREIGSINEKTPIVTVVHDIQVLDEELPWEPDDVSTDYIVTPTRIIRVGSPYPRPNKLNWNRVNEELLRKMRPLRELREFSIKSVIRRQTV